MRRGEKEKFKHVGMWAVGVDIGGTKIEVAAVDATGQILQRIFRPTELHRGPAGVEGEVVSAIRSLERSLGSSPAAVGVGVAGQIDPLKGVVRFAPNLGWRDVPLGADLVQSLAVSVRVTNDVRAATMGEWVHGAGKGCDDLVCLFVGTGIGGGAVSGGHLLTGSTNTAGEFGHLVVDVDGPPCTCGGRGCLEALAGGWAIAREAREAVSRDPISGEFLMSRAGAPERLTAKIVEEAAEAGDALANHIVDGVASSLIAGAVSLINALNPARLILGGGVVWGMPRLIDRVAHGIHERALGAARIRLEVLPALLGSNSGVIGAGTLALETKVT
jgi:glucokinase